MKIEKKKKSVRNEEFVNDIFSCNKFYILYFKFFLGKGETLKILRAVQSTYDMNRATLK